MRIFFDTNVLIDALGVRGDESLAMDAARVMTICRMGHFDVFMSVLSVPTIFYVLRGIPATDRKTMVSSLLDKYAMLPCRVSDVSQALSCNFSDLEDAMQYVCALDNNCDLIITRDKKDFAGSEMPVMSPAEFIAAVTGD